MCYKTRCQDTEDSCCIFLMGGNVRRDNRWYTGWNLKLLLNLHQISSNFEVILDTKHEYKKHQESSN